MQRVHKTVKTNSRRFCSVPQCSSYCTKDISLHGFPFSDHKLCKEWQIKLKIGKAITKHMLVCSKHFAPSDFFLGDIMYAGIKSQRRRLKKGVVPSQNLPISSVQTGRKKKACLRRHRQDAIYHQDAGDQPNIQVNEDPQTTNASTETIVTTKEKSLHIPHPQALHLLKQHTFTIDQGTQTDFPSTFKLPLLLNNDEKLNNFTGINRDTLKSYVKCCENVLASSYANETLDLETYIILVLCKLKLNISFVCLAILFGISSFKCSEIFYSTVTLLATSIRTAIYWPTKEEILRNLPKCFHRFKDTRVVLDCTEIKIQKFNNLKTRVMSYSHYKGSHTAKFLVGFTPSGLISYVSKAYGGRATDKNIFNEENIIRKLDPLDAVMVDKGVLIKKECEDCLVKVYQSPFLRKKKQLSRSDALITAQIARARVHVERTIQRIKIFKIFQEQIPWYIIPYIDDIMSVIAASVNLSPPIIAREKF